MRTCHVHVDHVQLLVTGHAVQTVVFAKGVQGVIVTLHVLSLATVAMILRTFVQLILVQ